MAKKRSVAVDVVRGIILVIMNVILYALILFAMVKVCQMSYSFGYQVFGEVVVEVPPGRNINFDIHKDESILSIGKRLEDAGIIVNAYSFYLRTKLTVSGTSGLKEGSYTLNTSMTYEEILDKILKSETT